MKTLDIIAVILLLVGGLNWGLVGLFDFNLVTAIFGHFPIVVKAVYVAVGVAAVFSIVRWKTKNGCCSI